MAREIASDASDALWFRCACMAALIGLVVGLYLWRRCRIAKRRGESAHERLRERERAARARHDSLLQSVQGLILRFHSIATRLPVDDATRVGIETILDQADAVVAEGRDDMLNLGSQPMTGADVVEALSDFVKSLQATFGPRFSVAMTGKPRAIAATKWHGIYAISRAAISRACLHPGVRHIDIEIAYGPDIFCLFVRSDGIGMQEHASYQDANMGHWKLGGMTESARA